MHWQNHMSKSWCTFPAVSASLQALYFLLSLHIVAQLQQQTD